MSEPMRAWIYRVALVVLPILVAYGILDEADVALWVAFVGALLVPGLAAVNTSTSKDTH